MWANEKDMLGNVIKAHKIFKMIYKKYSNKIVSISGDQNLGAEGKKAKMSRNCQVFSKLTPLAAILVVHFRSFRIYLSCDLRCDFDQNLEILH